MMKSNKSLIWSFVLLIIISALYRIIPGRPPGFAPQLAMALFAGSVIKDKKWAFVLPVLSMFISDCLFQFLYIQGLSVIPGFYSGQLINYILFAGMTIIGFFMKRITIRNIFVYSLIIPSVYFLLSNFFEWTRGSGLNRPKTFNGLMMCYADAVPFFHYSVIATMVFSAVLFGGWYLLLRKQVNVPVQG